MNITSRPIPSIFSVNLLFLVSMVLVLTLGSLVQSWNFAWGLIATEVLLILVPAVVFLRRSAIPLVEGLRLRPIRLPIALVCTLLGFATYMFSIVIDAFMAQLTGLPGVPLPPGSMSQGTLEEVGLFLGLAMFAPLCEEALFRGVLQGVYEQRRPARFAITVTALMFAIFHFRLVGLPGLLPVAFILGAVAWRTRSIYASMLVHFGMNATAVIQSLLVIEDGQGLQFLGLPAAGVGLLATAVLLFIIWRLQPAPEPAAPAEKDTHSQWWNYAPLALAGLVYVGAAGVGTLLNLSIGQSTLADVDYAPLDLEQAAHSRYRVSNQAGEEVGSMDCTLAPQGVNLQLDCLRSVRAYEVQTGGGYFQDSDHQASWSVTWEADSMDLLHYQFERIYEQADWNFAASVADGELVVWTPAGTQRLEVTPDVLLEYEWAWRMNALRPQGLTTIRAPFCYLSRWNDAAGRPVPQLNEVTLRLGTAEGIELPAGRMQAAETSFTGQAAWYTPEHAGPVRFDDGMLVYELVE